METTVSSDGTVTMQPQERRCPKWVRILRFSAKLIAKQVIMRTLKKVVKGFFSSKGQTDQLRIEDVVSGVLDSSVSRSDDAENWRDSSVDDMGEDRDVFSVPVWHVFEPTGLGKF